MANGRLATTRKINQPLQLQFIDQSGQLQEVIVMISDIAGSQAKLLIEAPQSVSITRGEIKAI